MWDYNCVSAIRSKGNIRCRKIEQIGFTYTLLLYKDTVSKFYSQIIFKQCYNSKKVVYKTGIVSITVVSTFGSSAYSNNSRETLLPLCLDFIIQVRGT